MNESPNLPGARLDEHLDEMTCMLYVEGQLDRKRAQEVSAHTQDCLACRTLLRALERESRLLTRAMLEEDEPLPSRLAAFQERAHKSMQWIIGAVVGLAASGAYAFYTGYVEPMQQRFEQAGFSGSSVLNLMIFQGAFWKGWESVLTLIEVLAMITVAGSGVLLLIRRMRRSSVFAMVVAGICAAAMLSSPAMATEFRKGDTVEIEKGENIKGDAFVSGHNVKIEGDVDGDLFLFCQNADIEGHVTGDVIAFAQIVRVNGQVDGNLRSFTNTIVVGGNVSKNMLSFGESITLDPAGKVGGSATVFSNSFTVDGHIGRDVLGFNNGLTLSGTVAGGLQAQGNTLRFNSGAQVDGPVEFKGPNEPTVSQGAKLASPVKYTKVEHRSDYRDSGFYVWRFIWAAAGILFGLVLFLLMPAFAREATDSAERYGASFGLGVLVLFGIPVAALIACITVVGIMIGISTFIVWLAALFCAHIVVGTVVGQWVMGHTRETWQLIGRMIVGVIFIRVVEMIPHLGGWVRFAAVLWGMGAIALALYRRFHPAGLAPAVPGAPVAPPPLPPNTTIGAPQPV